MAEGRPETLAVDANEAAFLCRLSPDVFEAHYDGPWVRIGRLKRVRLKDVDEWLERQAGGAQSSGSGWGALTNDRENSRRKTG